MMIFTLVSIILLILRINGHQISEWIIFGLCGASIIWYPVLYVQIYRQQKLINKIVAVVKDVNGVLEPAAKMLRDINKMLKGENDDCK